MNLVHFVANMRQKQQEDAPASGVRERRRRWWTVLLVLAACGYVAGCSIGSHVFSSRREVRVTPATYGLRYQDVWFAANDGVQLNGWYIPGNLELPALLFFHGNGGNLSDNVPYVRLLHSRGFPIFIFDYRGFGRSHGKPKGEKDLYQDARGALNYLEKIGWRRDRIIFYGQSLGGAVALNMALEARPRGLVMESCFTSLAQIAKHLAPLPYYIFCWWCFDLGFDNLEKINKNRVPLFIIHGDKDSVAPVSMGRQLYAKATQPKMLYIVQGGGHCDAFELEAKPYLEAWSRFLGTLQPKVIKTAKTAQVTKTSSRKGTRR